MSETGQLTPTEDSLIPPERAFQMDPNGLGGIAQNVNLFRGGVNVPVTVFSVKSRNDISADLTLNYTSNLGTQATTWNNQAPTGTVGLGWSFGYELIARDSTLSAQPTDGVCYLIANGASNRLYRTTVTADHVEFEAENYQFWRIRYYPADERWVIVHEDGTQHIYGGTLPDRTQSQVQYGIKWGGRDGLWTDATVQTAGQALYPTAWNLCAIVSQWGDAIYLDYSNELVKIGTGAGLSYTKSSLLKRVRVPMVQTVTLNYEPKIYNQSIRE